VISTLGKLRFHWRGVLECKKGVAPHSFLWKEDKNNGENQEGKREKKKQM
jgi:hypothetical protein